MAKRQDYDLPFLLQYENVAWYEKGQVRILDRRIYPTEITFVTCQSYQEVAQAITDMVTQSAGPYTAAGMGMALAGYECQGLPQDEQVVFLTKAAYEIAHARPTTANRMGAITENCLQVAKAAIAKGEDTIEAMFQETLASLERRYATMATVGDNLLKHIPNGSRVLTQCFGETIVGMLLRGAQEQGKELELYCAETRPYLQGARLTASCCQEMGFKTTLLTDNMVGYAMEHHHIDIYTSAADTIACDGYIANKIGTKQMALLAMHYGIPYFVTGIPDQDKAKGSEIVIEERDPQQVLEFRGIQIALEGVEAIYPSFDITPPHLISGIVTDKGTYSAYDVASYFLSNTQQFY
ncbi:S-methyl-5-thioribose-1-phosphate isomerase [Vagococcus intermedius]|uniref:S-methyl-5-thioribose-1-phosphate isomerase n=1 Tax=Vagococcus intermedius TaxID=2991418 RepID=A0AAF0CVV6_9ENTE|nr:S-methyl-5-thioribose-1-phosphate isomerase [Vagococcus intermedius]WEG73838.1 S-methyl-5-thioribose-1-phosphate isomerase [Vagococcus intermedius]WEG75923.1 S-methyl-5-thioribose-1-phosphate isomerase [Vagococcus intermedius]